MDAAALGDPLHFRLTREKLVSAVLCWIKFKRHPVIRRAGTHPKHGCYIEAINQLAVGFHTSIWLQKKRQEQIPQKANQT
jgi:hypothetical protein